MLRDFSFEEKTNDLFSGTIPNGGGNDPVVKDQSQIIQMVRPVGLEPT